MTTKRGAGFDVRKAILDPGFTPRAGDADALLALMAEGADLAGPAERALVRLGAPATKRALARAAAPDGKDRATVMRLLGRLAAEAPDPGIAGALVAGLDDAEERVRRAAAGALGRARPAEAEAALTAALTREASASARRAMLEALGKVGGEAARASLADEATRKDPGTEQQRARAVLMVTRTMARATPSTIVADRRAEQPVRVVLRCRTGLEEILQEELPPALDPRIRRNPPEGLCVEGMLAGAPIDLFAARTFLTLGFPLDAVPVVDGDVGAAVVKALTSPAALAILRHWTEGPLRFRLSLRAGGKRRAEVWRVAAAVSEQVPDLVNDPTGSPWEAEVYEARGLVRVELVPAIADPRFTYRKGDVPAASHPTIAAALVRVAGVRPDDVVWDPFVGSGTELCERALAGKYARLFGSDIEPRALEVAKVNLDAAGVKDAVFLEGNAATLRLPGGAEPTLIITNPPLGRRVQRSASLGPILDRFLGNVADVLAKNGRLVWISPFPGRTRDVGAARGLTLKLAREVDMGGFAAEMQVMVKR
jgi:23S rRNA G2445 N2-methylase RlmL